MYRIRLDEKSGLDVPGYINSMGATTVVLVHHVLPHGNPHYHAYLEIDVKENTLRQRIKRLGYSSSDFSIKKCDTERRDEYIQYLFNQKHNNVPTLVSHHNFDDQLLHQLQVQATTVAREYENHQSTKRTKQFTLFDLAQEIEETVNPPKTVNDLGHIDYTQDTIEKYTDVAIQVLRKYRKPFDMFLLRKLIITAMSSNHKGVQRIKAHTINYFLNN